MIIDQSLIGNRCYIVLHTTSPSELFQIATCPDGHATPLTQANGVVLMLADVNVSGSTARKARVPTKHASSLSIHSIKLASVISAAKLQPGALRFSHSSGTVQKLVRGSLYGMGGTETICPVLGSIPLDVCVKAV